MTCLREELDSEARKVDPADHVWKGAHLQLLFYVSNKTLVGYELERY